MNETPVHLTRLIVAVRHRMKCGHEKALSMLRDWAEMRPSDANRSMRSLQLGIGRSTWISARAFL